jgi:hypothetical protein
MLARPRCTRHHAPLWAPAILGLIPAAAVVPTSVTWPPCCSCRASGDCCP